VVILCGGAIENARMLLVSDDNGPAGLGNRHDLVGRYLMDHLRGPLGQALSALHHRPQGQQEEVQRLP
jgi:choline dehydrogenase-like flavoprotein